LISKALSDFPGKICKFPGKYLGLPLHTRKLRRVEFQPLLDKIGGWLPGWKGKLMSLASRGTLVKCVLTTQPMCPYRTTNLPFDGFSSTKMAYCTYWQDEEFPLEGGGTRED
jgi:hypothetical protein